MANFGTIEDLKKEVIANQNVTTITMEDLREALGAGRLGKFIRETLSKELAKNGLGHIPKELPSYQHQKVRIYLKGSNIDDIIMAVEDVEDEKSDSILRKSTGSDAEILNKIRELCCE